MKKQKLHSRVLAIFALTLVLFASWFALPVRYRQLLEPTAFAAPRTFIVNVNGDGADANIGDGICQTSVTGNCSLRAAIQEANANTGTDTINFNIPGAGVHTISPNTQLPAITEGVVIDGYSQPGASPNTLANGENAVLLIELNGANAGAGANGLTIEASGSTVEGLVINGFNYSGGFTGNGVFLSSSSGCTIAGNYIGTNTAGNVAVPNGATGVRINGQDNTIGGTTPAARNVISEM